MAQTINNLPAIQESGFNPWVRKICGEGTRNALHSWWATVHGVAKSRIQLRDQRFHFSQEVLRGCSRVCIFIGHDWGTNIFGLTGVVEHFFSFFFSISYFESNLLYHNPLSFSSM